ncbi:hypothetical protein [Streptomyces mirabilis]|uniref:hypothetical protein n=1 Tax=Streptomyces mirabilis TaxID=68239 RepID=UPI0036BEE907
MSTRIPRNATETVFKENGRFAGRVQVQPGCSPCGVTDINFVRAAAAGWRLVLGRLACAHCAGRFPAWMLRQF